MFDEDIVGICQFTSKNMTIKNPKKKTGTFILQNNTGSNNPYKPARIFLYPIPSKQTECIN